MKEGRTCSNEGEELSTIRLTSYEMGKTAVQVETGDSVTRNTQKHETHGCSLVRLRMLHTEYCSKNYFNSSIKVQRQK
jgi:hypothetical protein